ncbi:D-alanine--D-alanine ligase [Crassaminicella profunda]|uniref:D-alanine--D-alanine ligase n=1 Tax=Crassaminicella profunda TaxID=1286698 RepID=UPI001CA787FE|nr:D-alanine--D-alanine ligase [Crassaminicella profunda]QZY55471.1 D-alanine--D-alanine ligase [Crassaminicella profunda]
MTKKINVAIVFGSKSGEHEISLMSATSVMNAIDKEKYNVLPIGITKEGQWMIYNGPTQNIETGEWEKIAKKESKENPNNRVSVIPLSGEVKKISDMVDVVFPVLHGPFGEDGTIQGLLEMIDVPYVGAGVLASAVGMDKVYTKKVFEHEGLPVGNYMTIMRSKFRENQQEIIDRVEKEFEYPVFLKPANLGSSVGISKAHNREELIKGIKKAAEHDRKVVLEAFIKGREIECAVLGNEEAEASIVGEILPSHEFYDYNAKYFDDGKSKIVIPASIPKDKAEEIREMAVKAYKSIDCSGLARVDFFLEEDTMKVYINEVNTMPGFTKYSMYPLLWEQTGLSYSMLIDRLITLALERYKEK